MSQYYSFRVLLIQKTLKKERGKKVKETAREGSNCDINNNTGVCVC